MEATPIRDGSGGRHARYFGHGMPPASLGKVNEPQSQTAFFMTIAAIVCLPR
ncbi:MAG: hypothetical protein H6884_06970 [Rhodobiaceae bacterium]|nr:hypothetical protein [Rhodobiaceae bacterium]MCC0053783.1 hypothetical protein [Rhodobiaceae bacterium]